MKLLSWNVNGIRAIIKKGFVDIVHDQQPDMMCIQETKAHPEQVGLEIKGYHQYWNAAEKKGYSGTLILSKKKPLDIKYGLGLDHHDKEGRVITLEFPQYHLVNVYTPNAQPGLARIKYRMDWDKDFLAYCKRLDKDKPVIFCGDLNVAHKEIDLARPKQNRNNPGFSDQERAGFENIVKSGFVDSFRQFNQEPDQYSWWSYRMNARAKNIGWRIDYFLVSKDLQEKLKDAFIMQQIMGSDHCPVGIVLK